MSVRNLSPRSAVRFIISILLVGLLAGCAQTGHQIGYSVNVCCPGDYASYESYGLRTQDVPGFLSEYVVAELDAALQDKGLIRNDRLNDVVVTLSYRHVNLNPEQQDIDPFERRIEEDVMLRYIATLLVDIAETGSGDIVWSGQINRIHTVLPGEYMHEDNARPEFREAFQQVLSSYPVLSQ
jgi:hypothetical protein